MELKFIRVRQRAGIEAAKGKGVYKGRWKSVDDEKTRDLGVSRMTVYRTLADAEA